MIRRMIPFGPNATPGTKLALAAGMLAGNMPHLPLLAQSTAPAPATAPTPAAISPRPAAVPAVAGSPTPYQPNRFAGRAGKYYALFWGIDSPSVKAVEAGELIRFTYHVLDPQREKAIIDKKNDRYLIFPDTMIRLWVSSLEKVGQLRQAPAKSTPESLTGWRSRTAAPGQARRPRRHCDW